MDQISQIPNWRIKFSSWYINNFEQLKKTIIYVLIGVDFCIFTALVIMLAFFLISERTYQQEMGLLNQNLVNLQAFRASHQPIPLQWGQAQVLGGRNGRYTLVAEVTNPNRDWEAYVTYRFFAGGQPLSRKMVFVLPQEKKYLVSLGEEVSAVAELSFSTENISWKLRQQATDWLKDRLKFTISNITQSRQNYGNNLTFTGASFKVSNDSIFNFVEPGFLVQAYTGSGLVAINYLTTTQFMSGESRQLETGWLDGLSSISQVEVIPQVDIFDESVYYQPPSGPGYQK